MDILNWVYLLKNKLVKKEVQDPKQDLVILGNNVSYVKRGDKYQSYGMTVEDFAKAVGGLQGESYILVKGASDDPTVNGAELKAAYDVALASTPYGNPRGQGNEFSVIIGPGTYDMRAYNGTYGWELTGDYINMISLTGEPDVVISTFSVGGNYGTYKGLNAESAPSVGLGNYGQILLGSDTNYNVTAYFENCLAGDYSFGAAINISGSFKNCQAGFLSFGCAVDTSLLPPNVIDPPQNPNILSGALDLAITGNFENCIANAFSFGSVINNNIGVTILSGTFKNCTAGSNSFGSANTNCVIFDSIFTDCSTINGNRSFGTSANLTGAGTVTINSRTSFTNCKTRGFSFTPGQSFGYIEGPAGTGTCSLEATFTNCSAGNQSFGWTYGTANLTGKFINCEAGDESFGFNPFTYANTNTSGIFTDCTAGVGCFGSFATGIFTNCKSRSVLFGAGGNAFGFSLSGATQDAAGTFVSCLSAGRNSFGAVQLGSANASGSFYSCVSADTAFANSDGSATSNLTGKALYCHKTAGSFYTTPGGTPRAVLCINSALTVQTI